MIRLLVRFADESRELELADSSITIGRSAENAVALSDKKTSRKHAQVEKTDQGYRINDLGSGNGTKVNGREVNTALLAKGDEVKIGLTTLYILDVSVAPARVEAAPLPVAVEVAPPPAAAAVPPPAPPAEKPAATTEKAAESSRPKITRRAYVPKGSGGGRFVAAAATVIILGSAAYAAYVYLPQMQLGSSKPSVSSEKKADPAAKERMDALAAIRVKVDAPGAMTEEVVREANDLAGKHGSAEPQFEAVASQARLKWADQLGKMTFDQVEKLVTTSLQDHRYGDATDALKPLKNGADAAKVATLMTQVDTEATREFNSVNKFGKDLVERKQYSLAVEHYRTNAPHFRGTVYFKTLSSKVDSLQELARMEQEAAGKPAEIEIAKVPPKENPPPPPPPPAPKEMPKPAMEAPKPAMEAPKMPAEPKKPAMEAPKPKEPEKSPPPPPPPPPKPKEPEKPKEMPKPPTPGAPFKKPDLLCNCKRIVKGVYCIKCDRVLEPDDLRKNVCKRCEEPPKKVEMCVKKFYTVDGHPEKVSEKPITFEGKIYDIPQEDRARIIYYCNSCEEAGDIQGEIKHKADCAARTNVVKVCLKSGTGAHLP